jgi:hypothetical protein
LVRHFADIADHPRAVGAERVKKIERQRNEFLKDAWARAESLLHGCQSAYAARLRQVGEPTPGAEPGDSASQGQAFNRLLRAAMHMPAVEALFPAPWTAAARRVLPSPSPQLTATEMWGPVLAWCVLEWLAESVDPAQAERIALDLFDRLRLREPFGHAFTALGFKGEEAWRVAARIKVLLLAAAGAGKPQETAATPEVEPSAESLYASKPTASSARVIDSETGAGNIAPSTSQSNQEQIALAPVLWLDPDVRWLCGVHESEGHFYLVREQYEELLWWLLMPALLQLAGEATPSRAAVEELSKTVATALHSAEAAGYRINTLLGPLATPETGETGETPEPESDLDELAPPAESAPDAEA